MYPEFIAIYIGLGILAILQIATIILLCILFKKNKVSRQPQHAFHNQYSNNNQPNNSGVVFCVNCGTQYDATLKVCPKCGKPR